MKKTAALLFCVLAAACDMSPASFDDAHPDATGTWSETRVSRTTASYDANAVRFELSIRDRDGFVWGRWTISGDYSLPADPWQAFVVGDHYDGEMLLAFYDPGVGECVLDGTVQGDSVYVADKWCEDEGWTTVHLLARDTTAAQPPGSGAVEGRVLVDGEGMPGIIVTLDNGSHATSMYTNGSGMYRFNDLASGDYTVSISGYDTRDFEFAYTSQGVRVDDNTVNVSFTGVVLRTSGISGRVSVNGQGVVATVTLSGPDGTQSTGTNHNGIYAFAGLAAGDYTVSISNYDTRYRFTTTSHAVTIGRDESRIVNFAGST